MTLSLSPKVDDPAYRAVTLRRGRRGLRRADGRAARRRRRPAPDRDDLRHAEREGGDRRRARGRCPSCRSGSRSRDRPQRPQPLRPDGRGVLDLGRARAAADRRRQLLARRARDAAGRRGALARRHHVRLVPPERRACRTRSAATTSSRTTTSALLREFAEDGLRQRRRRLLRDDAGAHAPIAAAVQGLPPRDDRRRRRARPRFSGLEPFEIGPDTGFVMIGERTNVTGSARFRRLVEAGDYGAAVEVALEQVRGGANLLDVNMDADLLDSVEAMTTFLNLIATEPEVARIPIMVDSSRFGCSRPASSACRARGSSTRSPSRRARRRSSRRRGRLRELGAAVIVMAFDEQGQAETVERKVAICERAYRLLVDQRRLRAGGHHLRPERPRRRDRDRGARGLREGVHRGDPADQGALSRRAHLGRDLEPLLRVPRQRPRARGDARRLPLPRDPRRARHGDRQRRPARWSTRTSSPSCSSSSRTSSSTAGPTRPSGSSSSRAASRARGRSARSTSPGARRRSRSGSRYALVHGIVDFIEEDTEEARQQLDAAARRDRGPADGRAWGSSATSSAPGRCSCRRS